jgi:hypothetical protein
LMLLPQHTLLIQQLLINKKEGLEQEGLEGVAATCQKKVNYKYN